MLMSFEAGDIVELKSGGPQMTVASMKHDRAFCVWFNRREGCHEEQSGEFLVVTLQRAAPQPQRQAASTSASPGS